MKNDDYIVTDKDGIICGYDTEKEAIKKAKDFAVEDASIHKVFKKICEIKPVVTTQETHFGVIADTGGFRTALPPVDEETIKGALL